VAIRFLALESVIRIHQYQIDSFGGIHGLRDDRLLESAVSTPAATFGGQYLHADLFEMAAAAATFLEINELKLIADPDEFAELTMAVARGEITKQAIAKFLRANVEAM
jgi:death-on-curing protein